MTIMAGDVEELEKENENLEDGEIEEGEILEEEETRTEREVPLSSLQKPNEVVPKKTPSVTSTTKRRGKRGRKKRKSVSLCSTTRRNPSSSNIVTAPPSRDVVRAVHSKSYPQQHRRISQNSRGAIKVQVDNNRTKASCDSTSQEPSTTTAPVPVETTKPTSLNRSSSNDSIISLEVPPKPAPLVITLQDSSGETEEGEEEEIDELLLRQKALRAMVQSLGDTSIQNQLNDSIEVDEMEEEDDGPYSPSSYEDEDDELFERLYTTERRSNERERDYDDREKRSDSRKRRYSSDNYDDEIENYVGKESRRRRKAMRAEKHRNDLHQMDHTVENPNQLNPNQLNSTNQYPSSLLPTFPLGHKDMDMRIFQHQQQHAQSNVTYPPNVHSSVGGNAIDFFNAQRYPQPNVNVSPVFGVNNITSDLQQAQHQQGQQMNNISQQQNQTTQMFHQGTFQQQNQQTSYPQRPTRELHVNANSNNWRLEPIQVNCQIQHQQQNYLQVTSTQTQQTYPRPLMISPNANPAPSYNFNFNPQPQPQTVHMRNFGRISPIQQPNQNQTYPNPFYRYGNNNSQRGNSSQEFRTSPEIFLHPPRSPSPRNFLVQNPRPIQLQPLYIRNVPQQTSLIRIQQPTRIPTEVQRSDLTDRRRPPPPPIIRDIPLSSGPVLSYSPPPGIIFPLTNSSILQNNAVYVNPHSNRNQSEVVRERIISPDTPHHSNTRIENAERRDQSMEIEQVVETTEKLKEPRNPIKFGIGVRSNLKVVKENEKIKRKSNSSQGSYQSGSNRSSLSSSTGIENNLEAFPNSTPNASNVNAEICDDLSQNGIEIGKGSGMGESGQTQSDLISMDSLTIDENQIAEIEDDGSNYEVLDISEDTLSPPMVFEQIEIPPPQQSIVQVDFPELSISSHNEPKDPRLSKFVKEREKSAEKLIAEKGEKAKVVEKNLDKSKKVENVNIHNSKVVEKDLNDKSRNKYGEKGDNNKTIGRKLYDKKIEKPKEIQKLSNSSTVTKNDQSNGKKIEDRRKTTEKKSSDDRNDKSREAPRRTSRSDPSTLRTVERRNSEKRSNGEKAPTKEKPKSAEKPKVSEKPKVAEKSKVAEKPKEKPKVAEKLNVTEKPNIAETSKLARTETPVISKETSPAKSTTKDQPDDTDEDFLRAQLLIQLAQRKDNKLKSKSESLPTINEKLLSLSKMPITPSKILTSQPRQWGSKNHPNPNEISDLHLTQSEPNILARKSPQKNIQKTQMDIPKNIQTSPNKSMGRKGVLKTKLTVRKSQYNIVNNVPKQSSPASVNNKTIHGLPAQAHLIKKNPYSLKRLSTNPSGPNTNPSQNKQKFTLLKRTITNNHNLDLSSLRITVPNATTRMNKKVTPMIINVGADSSSDDEGRCEPLPQNFSRSLDELLKSARESASATVITENEFIPTEKVHPIPGTSCSENSFFVEPSTTTNQEISESMELNASPINFIQVEGSKIGQIANDTFEKILEEVNEESMGQIGEVENNEIKEMDINMEIDKILDLSIAESEDQIVSSTVPGDEDEEINTEEEDEELDIELNSDEDENENGEKDMKAEKAREELFLRERLLKATLLKKMEHLEQSKNEQRDKLELTKLEKEVKDSKMETISQLNLVLKKMSKMSDKKLNVSRLTEERDELKKKLEAAEEKVSLAKISLTALGVEVKQGTKHALDFRKKAQERLSICIDLGKRVEGEKYNFKGGDIEKEITSKLKEIRTNNDIFFDNTRNIKNAKEEKLRAKGLTSYFRKAKTVEDQFDILMPDKQYFDVLGIAIVRMEKKEFKFEPYISAFDIGRTRVSWIDVNRPICSFALRGICLSDSCDFQHLKR